MKLSTLLIALGLVIAAARCGAVSPAELGRVEIAEDGRGFRIAGSAEGFHPWGMNYGNEGRLMEDFWDADWETIVRDFHKLREMRANTVRVHLQVGRFMRSRTEMNPEALRQFTRVLALAEECGLRLDVTGLACYRPSDTPAWYDSLVEPGRWAAQAAFWEGIAEAGQGHASVFCYDLINEPISPGEKRAPGQWRSGSSLGGCDFLQFIALDPAGRNREDIPVEWIRKMRAAIRKHDAQALITVGLLPWSRKWHYLSGFIPEKVAKELDFLSVHIYPETKDPDEAVECLRHYSAGKPVVIEETFSLSCSVPELETFLRRSREWACGWVGHYDGESLADYEAKEHAGQLTPKDAIYREWLKLFVRLGPEFK